MELHIYKDADELSKGAAQWIADYIGKTLQQKDRFTIALSGGSTPQKLHKILAASPYKETIDWQKLHIFWGDERFVPYEDERNNAKMAFDTLLCEIPVPKSQIHIMRTDIDPETSAAEYEKILHQYFHNDNHSFDLVLLGMGDDGHTLSLFPNTPVIHENKKWVTTFFLKQQEMYRITLTAHITNRASAVAFLVAGGGKASALKEVLEGDFNAEKYPSQLIRPKPGALHWFVDEAAAKLLH
ncbi:MAG: 6-phosphogluconolactonase [Chitinophagaceae bacterium]